MRTIPFTRWIANAAVRWTSSPLPRHRRRQTERLQPPVRLRPFPAVAPTAVEAQHGGGPTREQLIQEGSTPSAAKTPNSGTGARQTIEFPLAKQQEFPAVTALAMGLSLNQTLVLLALLLGTAAAPGRSTVHRWVQAAGTAAGVVLKRLDQAARTLVLVGCLDEIFFAAGRSWWGSNPGAWSGSWGPRPPIARARPGRPPCSPGWRLATWSRTRARGSRPVSTRCNSTAARPREFRWKEARTSFTPSRRPTGS